MIIQEIKGNLVKTYSDRGVKVHGGFPEADYDEVYDPIDMHREYVETDIPVEEEEISKEKAYDILMGEENGE